jgi:hypothetical protein
MLSCLHRNDTSCSYISIYLHRTQQEENLVENLVCLPNAHCIHSLSTAAPQCQKIALSKISRHILRYLLAVFSHSCMGSKWGKAKCPRSGLALDNIWRRCWLISGKFSAKLWFIFAKFYILLMQLLHILGDFGSQFKTHLNKIRLGHVGMMVDVYVV